jgi:hypothetical protein
MPESVRMVVQRLVAEARSKWRETDGHFHGFVLAGGPGGASYLDANGEVWNWHWDCDGSGEVIERVPDGTMKVSLVAIAAEREPELAAWLPERPAEASDCGLCNGSAWLTEPWPKVRCMACYGLGWVYNSEPVDSAD